MPERAKNTAPPNSESNDKFVSYTAPVPSSAPHAHCSTPKIASNNTNVSTDQPVNVPSAILSSSHNIDPNHFEQIQKTIANSLKSIPGNFSRRNTPAKRRRPHDFNTDELFSDRPSEFGLNRGSEQHTKRKADSESDGESATSSYSYVGIRRGATTGDNAFHKRTSAISSSQTGRTSRTSTQTIQNPPSTPIISIPQLNEDRLPHPIKRNFSVDSESAVLDKIGTMIAEARSTTNPPKPKATMMLPLKGYAPNDTSSFPSQKIPTNPTIDKIDELRSWLKSSDGQTQPPHLSQQIASNKTSHQSMRRVPNYQSAGPSAPHTLPASGLRGSNNVSTNVGSTASIPLQVERPSGNFSQDLAPSPVFSNETRHTREALKHQDFKINSGLVRPIATYHTPLRPPTFTKETIEDPQRRNDRNTVPIASSQMRVSSDQHEKQPSKLTSDEDSGISTAALKATHDESIHKPEPRASVGEIKIQDKRNNETCATHCQINKGNANVARQRLFVSPNVNASVSSTITPPMPSVAASNGNSEAISINASKKWSGSHWKALISAVNDGLEPSAITTSDLASILMKISNNLPEDMKRMPFDDVARRLETWKNHIRKA